MAPYSKGVSPGWGRTIAPSICQQKLKPVLKLQTDKDWEGGGVLFRHGLSMHLKLLRTG